MSGRTRNSEMNAKVKSLMTNSFLNAPNFNEQEILGTKDVLSSEELAALISVTMGAEPPSKDANCNRVAAAMALGRLVYVPSPILDESQKRAAMLAIAAKHIPCNPEPSAK